MTEEKPLEKRCKDCVNFIRRGKSKNECAYFGTMVSNPKKIEQVDGKDCSHYLYFYPPSSRL